MKDTILLIALLGGVQGLLLTLSLTRIRTFNEQRNPYLILLLGMGSLHMLYSVLLESKVIYKVPHLVSIVDWFNLLYGPLLLFFVIRYFNPAFRLKPIHGLHLIPVLLYIYRIYPLYLQSTAYKLSYLDWYFESVGQTHGWSTNVIIRLFLGAYFLVAIYLFYKWKKESTEEEYSTRKMKTTSGIGLILLGFACFYFFSVIRILFFYEDRLSILDSVVMTFFIYGLGYLSLSQSKTLSKLKGRPLPSKKPRQEWNSLETSLEHHMQQTKPFLNPELTINELAHQLKVSPLELSRFLNQQLQLSFFNFVNSWRINEAKLLLNDSAYDRYSLDKIYSEVGFKSKSSFYSAFKKFTGITPAQFKSSEFSPTFN